MNDAILIGEYQLRNLLSNRARFIYFDLREPQARASEAPGHSLLESAQTVEGNDVVAALKAVSAPPDQPVVLICENGAKSVAAAELLAQNHYINVYVIDGGTSALDFSQA